MKRSPAGVVSWRMMVALATVLTLLLGLAGAPVARAQTAPPDPTCARADVVKAWQFGGAQVRAAAEAVLLGTDTDVCGFLSTVLPQRQQVDYRVSVNRIMAAGGSAVRGAAQTALDSTDAGALGAFLDSGWRNPAQTDLRVRVNQMMAAGGSQLRAAAQKALDSTDPAALQAFIDTGWRRPWEVDQRIRVDQIMYAGGPEVRAAAQRALDADTAEALTQFIDSEWPVAAARDQEAATIADLTNAAQAAGDRAAQETQAAKDAADRAATAAAAAAQAAQAAADAAGRANGDAQAAAAAAKQAADAANNAAEAAKEAVTAANAASAAARVAASAASRASWAASQAEQAASRANNAAAAAATDASKAAAARQAAQAARDIAVAAKKAADAAQHAGDAATSAKDAANAAAAAGNNALAAADAATQASNFAANSGADASQARAAAATARADANRANRAAHAAGVFADTAANAAYAARDAANKAVNDANAAAAAADDAATHAGDAARAAQDATNHANAATQAAQAAVDAANQAKTIDDAARAADTERIATAGEQADEAALAASTQLQQQQAAVAWDAEQAAKRSAETNRLIAEATDPATPPALAITDARKVALALATADGPWTRQAALNALGSSDDQALEFVRTGIAVAAGQDDRLTVQTLADTGTDAMKQGADAALAGSDADVAAFLRTQDYPGRLTDDRVAVNQVQAAAREAGNTDTVQKAQTALDAGTDAALREFLANTQFTAAANDERIKVNQILAGPASGPELKAGAQAALDSPPAYVHQFLTTGRYTAAQHDADTATHNAITAGLLAEATRAATIATQVAQEAQSIAATARGDAAAAANYAQQAQQSASQAAGYAQQAQQSAAQADQSAAQAAASAKTARDAAAAATTSANRAARSALWARASAQQASDSAADAYKAKQQARDSAIAAGKDQQAAEAAANQAYQAVVDRANAQRAQWMQEQAAQCLPSPAGSDAYKDCIDRVIAAARNPMGTAYVNSGFCSIFQDGSPAKKNCLYGVLDPNFDLSLQLDVANGFLQYIQAALGLELGGVLAGLIVACAIAEPCGAIVGGFLLANSPEFAGLYGEAVTLSAYGGAGLIGGLRLAGALEQTAVETEAWQAELLQFEKMVDSLAANGKLGPDSIPQDLVKLTEGWKPYGGLSREQFVARYWDPTVKDKAGNLVGDWNWAEAAPNGGAVPGTERAYTPQVGDVWDRFGDETGRYLSPDGLPYEQRALPPQNLSSGYRRYRWVKPWDPDAGVIVKSTVAKAFEQPGGGIQFKTSKTVEELKAAGYLKDVE